MHVNYFIKNESSRALTDLNYRIGICYCNYKKYYFAKYYFIEAIKYDKLGDALTDYPDVQKSIPVYIKSIIEWETEKTKLTPNYKLSVGDLLKSQILLNHLGSHQYFKVAKTLAKAKHEDLIEALNYAIIARWLIYSKIRS